MMWSFTLLTKIINHIDKHNENTFTTFTNNPLYFKKNKAHPVIIKDFANLTPNKYVYAVAEANIVNIE